MAASEAEGAGAAVASALDAAAAVAETVRNLLRLELVAIRFPLVLRVTLAPAAGRYFWFHPRTGRLELCSSQADPNGRA